MTLPTWKQLSPDAHQMIERLMLKYEGHSVNGVAGWYHQQRMRQRDTNPPRKRASQLYRPNIRCDTLQPLTYTTLVDIQDILPH